MPDDKLDILPASVFEYLNLTPDDRQELFLETITETSYTPDYWVDFNVAKRNASRWNASIDELDILIGTDKPEFERLIRENPDVMKLVPPLLGIRKDKFVRGTKRLRVKDPITFENYELDFGEIDENDIDRYVLFIEYSGLGEILRDKKISSAREALLAVEWAMSVSGRKNRAGKINEIATARILSQIISAHPEFSKHDQTSYENIKEWYGIDIGEYFANRVFDGSLYGNGRVLLIESNVFSGSGSKIRSVVNDFVRDAEQMSRVFLATFIYITDGEGWRAETHNLSRAIDSIITINYSMIKKGYLEQLAERL